MTRPIPWSDLFDKAFLGIVEEADKLAEGFGGIVRSGNLAGQRVVTKQMHRDLEDLELFKELYLGLLVPASPYMGFAITPEGHPRLVSAWMPCTLQQRIAYPEHKPFERQRLALGMLSAIEHMAQLGLVHCDVKPDNLLLDNDGTVYVIDFGSVSAEGDTPPMSCQLYRPPDTVVTLSWDVFSLGMVLMEVLDMRQRCAVELVTRMCSQQIIQRPSVHDCILAVSRFVNE